MLGTNLFQIHINVEIVFTIFHIYRSDHVKTAVKPGLSSWNTGISKKVVTQGYHKTMTFQSEYLVISE